MNYKVYLIVGGVVVIVGILGYALRPNTKPSAIDSNIPGISIPPANQQGAPATTSNQTTTGMENTIKTMLTTAYVQSNPPFPADTVRDVVVTQATAGGYNVHVDINAPAAFLPGKGHAYIVYVTLYKDNTFNIQNLSVAEHKSIEDSYGNTKDVAYMTTSMDSSLAKQINWNTPDINLILLEQLRCTPYYTGDCGDSSPAVE